jgi:inositol hexakisphosphate/diphosphoinositol-pentakisphosphate kinase
VIGIVRHGDRTPKQKMKVRVSDQKFIQFFHTNQPNSKKDLKVKSKTALIDFLEITRQVLKENAYNTKDYDKELCRRYSIPFSCDSFCDSTAAPDSFCC